MDVEDTLMKAGDNDGHHVIGAPAEGSGWQGCWFALAETDVISSLN